MEVDTFPRSNLNVVYTPPFSVPHCRPHCVLALRVKEGAHSRQ